MKEVVIELGQLRESSRDFSSPGLCLLLEDIMKLLPKRNKKLIKTSFILFKSTLFTSYANAVYKWKNTYLLGGLLRICV
jgi:hypothetical protein